MEIAVIANFLLLFAALGVNLVLDSRSASDDPPAAEPRGTADAYSRTDTGTEGDDSLTADRDNLAFFLGGGDDDLTASPGADYASMGSGNDSATLGTGHDIAFGGEGRDTVLAGDAEDTLTGDKALAGEAGHDLITGVAGAASLPGGSGDDPSSGYTATAAATQTTIDVSDPLSAGIDRDPLIIGHEDQAKGGAAADTLDTDHRWGEGSEVSVITDYVRGTDVLQLQYTPVFDLSGVEIPPVVTVAMGPANAYAIIRIDGDPVAHLTGATTLQASDIILQPAMA